MQLQSIKAQIIVVKISKIDMEIARYNPTPGGQAPARSVTPLLVSGITLFLEEKNQQS